MGRIARITLAAALTLTVVGLLAGCGCQEKAAEETTGQIDEAKDAAARVELMSVKTGVQAFIASTGQAPVDASQATIGGFVQPWPTNPWTQKPMQPGEGVGDYAYTPGAGTAYTLSVHLSDDSTYTAP